MPASFIVHQLTGADCATLRKLNALFAEAFADPRSYAAEPPDDAYLQALLGKRHVVVLVALAGDQSLRAQGTDDWRKEVESLAELHLRRINKRKNRFSTACDLLIGKISAKHAAGNPRVEN